MPTDPWFFSARSGSEPAAHQLPGGRYDDDASDIRRQAREIINAVLSDPAPEQAGIRDQLREHLAAHPGNPERALAEHLMALRSVAWPSGETTDVLPLPTPSTGQHRRENPAPAAAEGRSRIQAALDGKLLMTAFQPIFDLSTGTVVGVEAFTRFVSDGNDAAGWFTDAAEERLGSELELAALECALTAAQHLPAHLYVALKLSSGTCRNPLLPELLLASALPADRMVLQLADALSSGEPSALAAALLPLRRGGFRLAAGHIGLERDSIADIRELRPDIIKLDRNLIAEIDTDPRCRVFTAAMTRFAGQFGATLVAEGIETREELAAVTALGVSAGQGYFLGRPSTRPQDWASWNHPAPGLPTPAKANGATQA